MSKKKPKLKSFYKTGVLEAGCDEAGRGCLAGPVCAAAVILPADFSHPVLTDSKQLSDKVRRDLRNFIQENAIAWGVAMVDHTEIDKINILHASILAMHRALEELKHKPEHILVDGKFFKPFQDIPHQTIIKGDSLYLSIAAASILAKTTRDDYMIAQHEQFPHYQWDKNKGYATLTHREAIKTYGTCELHRKSFKLKDNQKEIPFPEE